MSKNWRATLLEQVWVSVLLNVVNGAGYNNIQLSSNFFFNVKFSVPGNPFKIITMLPDSEFKAHLACGRSCSINQQCQAFNIWKNDTAHFCEMLTASMRVNHTRVAYIPYPGATVWEKLSQNAATAFIDAKLLGVAPANYCEVIRPGCRGVWPSCNDCVKSCIDCHLRYNYNGFFTCTMWPGPTEMENTPITTTCYDEMTHLIRRRVNLASGKIEEHNMLPFRDMNRLIRLNAYSRLQFSFHTGYSWYQALYNNPYITENGTLMNLTFRSSNLANGDGLKLGSSTLAPTPFITVKDDKYGCGSFWLFDKNNATYCPGGGVGFFGAVRFNLMNQVIDSGIHWPLATMHGNVIEVTDLGLSN